MILWSIWQDVLAHVLLLSWTSFCKSNYMYDVGSLMMYCNLKALYMYSITHVHKYNVVHMYGQVCVCISCCSKYLLLR